MKQQYFEAFALFFATIGPIDLIPTFIALTKGQSDYERRRTAIYAVIIASVVLAVFAFGGSTLLARLGISVAALQVAGGILILLIGLDMVLGSQDEDLADELKASQSKDVTVFPLAMPLIAGPGAIAGIIVLMARYPRDSWEQISIMAGLYSVLILTLSLFLMAAPLASLLGKKIMDIVSRLMGILLTALAVQFIFEGIEKSGLLG
ncbi:MAG: MarC family protein [Alphaproteobacteria bacterium]